MSANERLLGDKSYGLHLRQAIPTVPSSPPLALQAHINMVVSLVAQTVLLVGMPHLLLQETVSQVTRPSRLIPSATMTAELVRHTTRMALFSLRKQVAGVSTALQRTTSAE